MRKPIRALLALAALASVLLVPASAQAAVPVQGCQARTSTGSDPGPWRFDYLEDWWQAGSYRVSAGCPNRGYIIVHSDGWRFNAYQCGQMWIRRIAADGSTYIMPGSVKHVCGGTTVVLASRLAVDTRFWIEGWPYAASDRRAGIWPVGTFVF